MKSRRSVRLTVPAFGKTRHLAHQCFIAGIDWRTIVANNIRWA